MIIIIIIMITIHIVYDMCNNINANNNDNNKTCLIEGNAVLDAVVARELVRREGLARAQDVLELVDEGL